MSKAPFLPIRDLVIFPNVVTPIYVGRANSIATLEKAIANKTKLVLGLQKDASQENPTFDGDIYEVGVIANIVQIIRMPNNNIKVLVEAEDRVKIKNIEKEENEYVTTYTVIKETLKDSKETEAIYRKVFTRFEKYVSMIGKFSSELILNLKKIEDYSNGLDIMASNLNISSEKKQQILEISNVRDRGYRILDEIVAEMEIASLEKTIDDKVKNKMNEAQRAYYLKEKISVMKEELGDFSQDDDVIEIVDRLKNTELPKEVREKLEAEVKKLTKMQPFSAESSVIRNYIEAVLDLPWNSETNDVLDLKKASQILERDHYGLKDAKEKVLDYLAVKKLNPSMNGVILCLAGPPGIGKTSLVKSIAESMGRKFVRVSLGGVRDEAEIRGHRRTYVGSMPGKIMKAMKEAGTNNPVILLDEIDKMSNDFKGDPASAMLEVLDPEQNKNFEDHYIDMPFDLSKVFFVSTANDLRNVSAPLRDRMDILQLSSYTEFEKLHIAQNFLLKQAQKENGLANIDIKIPDKVMFKLIDEYTREAGVRNLKREIINICRKLAREVVEKDIKKFNLKATDLEKYLGKAKFRPEKSRKAVGKIGVVNGLAWTAVGGVTLDVQGVDTPGKGEVTLTGTLGNVMKESASVAMTYVKANLKKYPPKDKDFFKDRTIHLHFPEGATPKDGPSAGITITTAIVSVLTNKKVRQDIAMTGEITITGDVLAIGGVREKVIGAHRAGIKEVILPEDNRVDTDEIPDELKSTMKIHFAKTYDDVSKLVFVK
ncbi:ATP-dependent protease La [Fusobacterium vincentii ATCC 51190]|uniref:Lon protease n=2 Tax=Fusobacterium vincentii TaxID=155615 RepID=A0AAJ1FQ13_FUSVC|nr:MULTISPECIES: endopeptidase La [Fusobacterium]ETS98021.1 endopeptidase La [Fusobacterium sp. CM21]EEO40816.1 lon protease [Fusobacterium vincentii 4_1_13]EJG09808.1 ATP-dependent protease La [Fusobacterium vincentii ATCC 51190]ERT47458.1 lon protease [Fusobacterium nucleatum CTI-7]MCG6837095.1 endopeptidase La [Fusobacterium nucleatum]